MCVYMCICIYILMVLLLLLLLLLLLPVVIMITVILLLLLLLLLSLSRLRLLPLAADAANVSEAHPHKAIRREIRWCRGLGFACPTYAVRIHAAENPGSRGWGTSLCAALRCAAYANTIRPGPDPAPEDGWQAQRQA